MDWGSERTLTGEWRVGEERLRVLLVDDQVAVRELTIMLLCQLGFAIAAEARSGEEALRQLPRRPAQLVVLGLALPEMSGPDLLVALRRTAPGVRTVVFTGTRNAELIAAGLEARPFGFVHKTEPLAVFREALSAVAGGGSFLGPFATQWQQANRGRLGLAALAPQQRRLLQLIAEGLSTKEAAERMAVSPRTAENYRMQLMQRLGVRDVASLTRYAVRCGVVE